MTRRQYVNRSMLQAITSIMFLRLAFHDEISQEWHAFIAVLTLAAIVITLIDQVIADRKAREAARR